ncbi:hypothetical protein H6P81_018685 [Aristolochia fimbriata]|uniref:Uncharacterized protein n=1 Tax=Aristolochia fimbriata TaxID=158543 RepID=A0AAV7E4Y8_ARIFI|nr:hypothetical protein H6P81_018685 [Aristolochia fimbriata]
MMTPHRKRGGYFQQGQCRTMSMPYILGDVYEQADDQPYYRRHRPPTFLPRLLHCRTPTLISPSPAMAPTLSSEPRLSLSPPSPASSKWLPPSMSSSSLPTLGPSGVPDSSSPAPLDKGSLQVVLVLRRMASLW